MALLHPFLLLILLFTLSIPPNIIATKPGKDLIHETCKHTLYYDTCVASLQSSSESQTADLQGLASIALHAAADSAIETSNHIALLLNNTTDSFIQQCLSDCSENYLDAIDQIEDSIAALDSKGYNDVNVWVTAAMSDSDTCEEGFKEQPGYKSMLTDNSAEFYKLCSNALAITKLLSA
ncbi:putative invertase inhibitor [Tasmannia lanceolata]|uniref:putative invertase inhibitor n=1 Tax=Tasmannia lanceolata TaxID=3420 RepID=UPI004062FE4F